MKEEFQNCQDNFIAKVWATDVDSHALKKAEFGEYESGSLEEVSQQQLEKYFIQVGSGKYRIKDDIKQMVKFVKHNLISDPPLKCMDIIFCRNVLIYLTRQQHELLFEVFNQALNPKGYLVIGKVEGIWGYAKNLLTAVDASCRIYQKVK
jgi:chemotaxis methyl-accepting protein methylase